MLTLLLVAGLATFVGVRDIVGQFSQTARRLDRESASVATLQAALDDHETIASQLVDGSPTKVGFAAASPVEEATFLAEQNGISASFDAAARAYQGNGADIIGQARILWQAVMSDAGLWGTQLQTFVPSTGTAERAGAGTAGDGSDQVRGILSELQPPTLDAMQTGLTHDAALERDLIAVLAALFVLALSGTVYFRRRMAKDLVRPVASLHQGVLSPAGR